MDIIQTLRQEIPNLPRKLSLTARYALDNPDRIALDSMRTSAAAAGVTSTTMLRLARHFGFQSYEDFKAGFQSQLVATGFGARAGVLQQARRKSGTETLSQRIFNSAENNIRQAGSHLNQGEISEVARLLRNAPACYIVGSGSLFWLGSMMKNTGNMILPNLRLVGAEYAVATEAMGDLGSDDVVVGFGLAPYATRTMEALRFGQERGAHTVAFTDRPSSPLATVSKFVFCGSSSSPHYYPSLAPLIVLIETLLATVVAEGDGSELERIRQIEEHRKANAQHFMQY